MKTILYLLMFLLCGGSLFLRSELFVDIHVTPKWYFALFMEMVLVLTLIAFFFCGKTNKLEYKSLLPNICFILAVLCTGQAVYGILQYFDRLPAVNRFQVTGSFDNPAGFAASLCAVFPFLFYFIRKKYNWQCRISLLTVIIITIAVILSASRAGMICLFVSGLFFLFYRIGIQAKKKMILSIVAIVITVFGLYFLKKDSADGRLLIWRCSLEMIKDKPLLGHGYGGFKAGYMNYQANYFEQNPNSSYTMLADNVNRPFNEYILLVTDYGLVGLILLLVVGRFLWKSFRRCRQEFVARLAGCCLLSIAVFAFFSYPLRYPFVWIMMVLSIATIIYKAKYPIKIPNAVIYPVMLLMIPAIIFSGLALFQRMTGEIIWRRIANESLLGKTEQMLPKYEQLHKPMVNNELFLYNYAAELNVAKHYEKSLGIAHECERLWADYDLQMIMADNHEKLQQYEDAERHYKKAAAMCPVKFMPLYRLTELYLASGQISQAKKIAEKIIDKEIKIPSSTINVIKDKMRSLINGQDSINTTLPKSRAGEKSNNKIRPRQDNFSENRVPGRKLPP